MLPLVQQLLDYKQHALLKSQEIIYLEEFIQRHKVVTHPLRL